MASPTTPHAISPPPESALAPDYAGANLTDAYAIILPQGTTRDIDSLAKAILAHPAPWVGVLMRIRDAVMGMLGIKTAKQIRAATSSQDRDRIDFFPVISRSPHELIVGEDDRHLDFRTSVLIRADEHDAAAVAIVTTVVRCHNRLGRLYLAAIRPFHIVIVKAYLRRAAMRGWPA
ncbi:DUF2867 domain-containing protein [Sphingomonas colocasiae]|uniref:DUF2867 domain-containing protein n=1 Tax=Sphingomonas colocasiae TaxID=1848973 RepID=A0ABS7PME9_9SPHN|nr:DUF2867 domain-containing protein [Sphingomonas colocasiae]MBY8822433.1 DUF2867 domain-containing protein [Sphingomonas colocasiae]